MESIETRNRLLMLADMVDLYTLRCCLSTIAWQLEYLEAAILNGSSLMMESCRDHINVTLSEMAAEGVLI